MAKNIAEPKVNTRLDGPDADLAAQARHPRVRRDDERPPRRRRSSSRLLCTSLHGRTESKTRDRQRSSEK